MHTAHGFVWSNALWSFALFVLAMSVFLLKMHAMRKRLDALIQALPTLGSQFVRAEIEELKQEASETNARLNVCEEKLGLDGNGQG